MSATRTLLTLGPTSVVPCFLVRKANPAEVSWDAQGKVFVGEASTMQWGKGTVALKSERTGDIQFFDNATPKRDRENDIQYWDLRSSQGNTLRIFNT